jgi:hypothetical protein
MIIVRFMEISLGHARMQVNTLRRGLAQFDRNGSFGKRGYDLRRAMEDRLEKPDTIGRP